jgi:hypothetical protein
VSLVCVGVVAELSKRLDSTGAALPLVLETQEELNKVSFIMYDTLVYVRLSFHWHS